MLLSPIFDRKVAITGWSGFLGAGITDILSDCGCDITYLEGDVRDPATFESITHDVSYLFHFAAPSSQTLFARNPDRCIDTTITGFMNAKRACEKSGTRLIYPSTGILSSDRGMWNDYAFSKHMCERIAAGSSNLDSLGLRIFATYGWGEGHKRDYASVPFLFARDMLTGKTPVVFGDGEQRRDFIFQEDTAKAVVILASLCSERVVDVGTGRQTSFNTVIKLLAEKTGYSAAVRYVESPKVYPSETQADNRWTLDALDGQLTSIDSGLDQLIKEVTS